MKTKIFCLVIFFNFTSFTQIYIPGKSYFGKNNYTEYIAGSLPIIISAPHGGYLTPINIPDRTCNNPTTVRDSYTQELIREIDSACLAIFNCHPHIIICHLDRKKLDANRNLEDGACGNNYAVEAWNDFHGFINIAKEKVKADYQKGFYIDLHGHGHPILRLELGYLFSKAELNLSDSILNFQSYINKSSIRELVSTNKNKFTHSELLRGEFSFGNILHQNGFASVPSLTIPFPLSSEDYFSGGYNTSIHSSAIGGTINGVQIESHYTGARDIQENRKKYAMAIAKSLKIYLLKHIFNENDLSKCVGTKVLLKDNKTEAENVNIFPNPTKGKFTLNLKLPSKTAVNIEIYNLIGQRVYIDKIYESKTEIKFPKSAKQGIYFLKIENEGKLQIKKLVFSLY